MGKTIATRLSTVSRVGLLGVMSAAPLALLSIEGVTHAAVTQPSGETMPQPAPKAETDLVMSRGFAADAVTLAGLFKYHQIGDIAGGDMGIDPVKDAQITPGTFSPQCGLTGTMVLHGGGCKNALGWYNATEPATKPDTIYPLVPANPSAAPLMCMDGDFCPLATRANSQPGQHTWADPLPEFAGNIRNSPNWKKGLIGFALIGVTGGQCSQTKYSQAELNDKNSAGKPWITTLIYQSEADPNAYYIAFEDLPTSTASWKGSGSATNDGDFNDFVFYVSGISCKDGGKPCTVPGAMGICAGGVTECGAGGMNTTCRQAVKPQTEACDGVDNDCNGMVDEGDLCPANEICDKGVCVHKCDEGEFKCLFGQTCDTDGYCKDTRCLTVKCAADQICNAGVCVGGCDGVKCPHGQACRNGHCVEPCAGVTCETGRVCEEGACQPACGDCRDCPTGAGKTCATSGARKGVCLETGCENKTCPSGQVCIAGTCKDGCDGVTCPGGQACMNGSCMVVPMPDAGTPPPPPPYDAGLPPPTGSGGTIGTTGGAGTTGAAGSTPTGAGGTTGTGGAGAQHIGGVATCSCDTADGPGAGGLALFLAAFALAAVRPARRAAVRFRRRSE